MTVEQLLQEVAKTDPRIRIIYVAADVWKGFLIENQDPDLDLWHIDFPDHRVTCLPDYGMPEGKIDLVMVPDVCHTRSFSPYYSYETKRPPPRC